MVGPSGHDLMNLTSHMADAYIPQCKGMVILCGSAPIGWGLSAGGIQLTTITI